MKSELAAQRSAYRRTVRTQRATLRCCNFCHKLKPSKQKKKVSFETELFALAMFSPQGRSFDVSILKSLNQSLCQLLFYISVICVFKIFIWHITLDLWIDWIPHGNENCQRSYEIAHWQTDKSVCAHISYFFGI